MNKKHNVTKALLITVLHDIMLRDSSVSLNRILLHIRAQHKNISITEMELTYAFADAETIIKKLDKVNK